MTLLRAYFLVLALGWPSVAYHARAEVDWAPEIVRPSPWDWLPEAAFLPSLGRHPLPARGE